jgi:RluA family pseudouridine synthase
VQTLRFRVSPEFKDQRLDQVLAVELPRLAGRPLSKSKVRQLIVAGAVYLNRSRVRIASKTLRLGAEIEVHIRWDRVEQKTRTETVVMDASWILFEDEDLIVVNKPPGLPTQPTVDEARANLFAVVKRFLKTRQSGDPYLGLHHRLDRDTSGVVLFTKTVRANAGIARAFQEHLAQKTYVCLSRRDPQSKRVSNGELSRVPPDWIIQNFLGKVGKGRIQKFGSVRSGGDPAETRFAVLERLKNDHYFIQAQPKTGRTHQIRVHLSEEGLPIVGDSLYGALASPIQLPGGIKMRLALHARELELPHPITGVSLKIQSPIPEDLQSCLKQLQS